MSKQWIAEQTAHPDAKADGWAVLYDTTPGGRKNEDGTTSFGIIFPAILISDLVAEPEKAANDIAAALNFAAENGWTV